MSPIAADTLQGSLDQVNGKWNDLLKGLSDREVHVYTFNNSLVHKSYSTHMYLMVNIITYAGPLCQF